MNENDILIRCDELEWQPTFPGGWIKRLRSCEKTGQWTQLLKLEAGAAVPPHFHLGSSGDTILICSKQPSPPPPPAPPNCTVWKRTSAR
jgi:anti-sigma factor ChrR (cupin superfamily)